MKRLKELREGKHISQQRLAIELNVSQATISKYELGQADPDIPTIVRLAEYFHVSADYLLEISDSKQNISDSRLSDTEKQLVFDFKRLDKMQKAKGISARTFAGINRSTRERYYGDRRAFAQYKRSKGNDYIQAFTRNGNITQSYKRP